MFFKKEVEKGKKIYIKGYNNVCPNIAVDES